MTNGRTFAIVIAILAAVAGIELAMGRVPICTCGTIELWHGAVKSAGNSQHLTDWYTPSHVIHGIAFYALLWLLARHWPVGTRLVAAVAIEAAWEIAENTPMVIDRYRAATIALDYYGDSVINSIADLGAMMLGFWLASRLPRWASVALVVVAEVGVGLAIRDNLMLNVLMLVHPIEAIRQWQLGA